MLITTTTQLFNCEQLIFRYIPLQQVWGPSSLFVSLLPHSFKEQSNDQFLMSNKYLQYAHGRTLK